MPAMSEMQRNSLAFTLHNVMVRWDLSPFPLTVLAVLILLGVWYLRADWSLAVRGRRWPGGRTAAFIGGLLAIDIAFQSPLATFTMLYFQAHVLQHLLLMVVGPTLLALGAPSTLLLQTASRKTKERWLAVLRSGPFALLSHPLTAWCLYFGLMIIFFLTSLVNVAMNHMALMDLLNVVFLLGGTLYWWPMIGLDPIIHWKMNFGARMLNILLGSAVEAFLGVAILADSKPVASMYSLASTHSGGALLWVSTEFVSLAAFLPIFLQWGRSEDRAAARADARLDRMAAARVAASEAPGGYDDLGTVHNGMRELSAWEAAWLAKTGHLPGITNSETPSKDPVG